MSTPSYTEQSLGKRGSEVITASALATEGSWAIIVAGPQGATIAALTCTNKENAQALKTIPLPAGYTSYGNFTRLRLDAGAIEAYNA